MKLHNNLNINIIWAFALIGGGLTVMGFEHWYPYNFFTWDYIDSRTTMVLLSLFFCSLSGILLFQRKTSNRIAALLLQITFMLILAGFVAFHHPYIHTSYIPISLKSGVTRLYFVRSTWTTIAQSLLHTWIPLTSIALLSNKYIANLFHNEKNQWQESDVLDSPIAQEKQKLSWIFHSWTIIQTIGFMFFYLGTILLSLTLDLRSDKYWLLNLSYSLPLISFALGIGLIFKTNFTRWILILTLGVAAIAVIYSLFSYLIYYSFNEIPRLHQFKADIGVLIGFSTLLISGFLLFSNKILAEECG